MPWREVRAQACSPLPPSRIWAAARDFAAPWHPAVAEMREERDEAGRRLRIFTTHGDPSTYVERLTWFSDSEMSYAYELLEGVRGMERYDARLSVAAAEGGAVVSMTARLLAPEDRADRIAAGTQMIFDAGVEALAALSADPPPPAAAPAAIPVETRVIDDPPRLAVSYAGGPGETLCLFLHGIGGARGNWDRQLRAVAPLCPAAALDLRGYGDSTLGPARSTVDDYCADILRVAEAFGARRVILVGLSYGAWIATSFAMRRPDMLAGLVLSGGCTGMSEAGPEERDSFRLSREAPLAAGQTPADFAPAVVNVIAGPNAGEETRAALLASMSAIPAETYRDALMCFTNPLETFDFAKLTMPTLLMTGEHDRLAPPHEIKRVAERIWDAAPGRDVRFETLAGAGHVCNLEAPAAYDAALTELIARVAR